MAACIPYTIGVIRYAITDGKLAVGSRERWIAAGVTVAQLRAKEVDAGELAAKARALLAELAGAQIALLINGRADVAMATGAAGVHLTGAAEELTVAQVRRVMPGAMISVSCHTLDDVRRARDAGADLVLFGPVFGKREAGERVQEGVGLDSLREACEVAPGKVLALGGLTEATVGSCIAAGAAGVAAIRLFS